MARQERWWNWTSGARGVALAATLAVLVQLFGCATAPTYPSLAPASQTLPIAAQDPAELYGELFERVQLGSLFEDSKYFVDMIPREDPQLIVARYRKQNPQTKLELDRFIKQHFTPPVSADSSFVSNTADSIERHIQRLWKFLKQEPHESTTPTSSLIPLPYPYIVPGGRFREIYYWDSYFTQLGLLADHEDTLFQDMVRNFAYLLMSIGRIPNGNRDYYLGRSQPPFFSHMVSLWQQRFGGESAVQFLPALKKEHTFWMTGERLVHVEGGELNRYWDDRVAPRSESYKEDVALAKKAKALWNRPLPETYRDLRAGAESGWDFSTRWFNDPGELATIATTSFAPIDLNSLVYHLEVKISELSRISGDLREATRFGDLARKRRSLIHRHLWDEKTGTFRDYHWRTKALSPEVTVAMVAPLFVGLATNHQARRVADVIARSFLKPGGLVTTLRVSGQQWDAPNGWPPHQWMAYAGLRRYRIHTLAELIRNRWLSLNRRVFKSTGKLMEKYNVIQVDLRSGGGEYPLQDGFGWTNGVYRALSNPSESVKHLTN